MRHRMIHVVTAAGRAIMRYHSAHLGCKCSASSNEAQHTTMLQATLWQLRTGALPTRGHICMTDRNTLIWLPRKLAKVIKITL
ncbi:hypothetical protein GDO78_021748 [Eleutherodactylus coqui]|uniref:Uncharacterized protein n=1 Tax=Eleutherodactylus coqui TaxID=57060 RepID=A0A8J6EGP4_ELECQ|nr:hypothetical protein GDO78_021748 [Eleutherodactylus coqui]